MIRGRMISGGAWRWAQSAGGGGVGCPFRGPVRRLRPVAEHEDGLAVAFDRGWRSFARRVRTGRTRCPRLTPLSSLEAADVELFARPRQRHIEQAAVLLQRLRRAASLAALTFSGASASAIGKTTAILRVQKIAALARRIGQGGGVGQDDDVGLQALGAVHGHHAHLVAAALHVALDLGVARARPRTGSFPGSACSGPRRTAPATGTRRWRRWRRRPAGRAAAAACRECISAVA